MPIINIPKPLRERLGEEATDSLVEVLREFEKEIRNGVIEAAEDRFARRLAEEMGKLRSEMHDEIGKLRSEMHGEIGKLKAEMYKKFAGVYDEIGKLRAEIHDEIGKLRAEMYQFKGDIVKWMFIFWIGQVIALGGLMFALLKFL